MLGTPAPHKALEVCPTQLLRSKSQRVTPDAYLFIAVVLTLFNSIDQVPFAPKYVSHSKFAFFIEFCQVSNRLFDFTTGLSNGGPTDTNDFSFFISYGAVTPPIILACFCRIDFNILSTTSEKRNAIR